MKFTCRINWHDWSTWINKSNTDYNKITSIIQERICKNCNKREIKRITIKE